MDTAITIANTKNGDIIKCKRTFKISEKMPLYAVAGKDYKIITANIIGVTFNNENNRPQTEMWETINMYFTKLSK